MLIGEYKYVTDSYILSVLNSLQKEYDFKIISIHLKGCFYQSSIKIRCNREDKYKIFNAFCNVLDRHIENIKVS